MRRLPLHVIDADAGTEGQLPTVNGDGDLEYADPAGITIEQEGVEVATDVRTINFLGDGVVAADATGGVVDVTIEGGEGGGGSTPTVVSSAVTFLSAVNNGNVTIPAGASVGDVLIIFTSHYFSTTVPAGWVQLDTAGTTNLIGSVLMRICESGDPGATQNVAFGGNGNGYIVCVAVTGATLLNGSGVSQNSTNNTALTRFLRGPETGNLILLYGGWRATNSTISSTIGTSLQQRTADASAGMNLLSRTAPAGAVGSKFTSNVTGASVVSFVALGGS